MEGPVRKVFVNMIMRRERVNGGDKRREYIRMFWSRRGLSALLTVFLLLMCAACSTGNTSPQASASPTARAALTPTATSLPAGTVLYKADWSKGLKSWGNTTGWKIVNGMALSNLSEHNALTVPYLPVVHNYAISCRFQIVQVPHTGGYFIIQAAQSAGKDGYTAGLLNLYAPGAQTSPFGNPQIQIYLNPMDDMQLPMSPLDFEPGNTWHTYRVEIKGPAANLFMDGVNMSTAVSSRDQWLSNGPLQLISALAVVRVSDVTITAL